MITLFGLMCNCSLNFLTIYYGGLDNSVRIPSWVLHLCSFFYFAYYLLDNLDGKQARRTNSSSELGMILDHACDALTTFIFTIGLSSIVGSQTPFLYFVLWSMTSFPFYFTTLEAYYLRILRLGYLNGASEGTIFACFFMSLSGVIGINLFYNIL
jgi:ethanolaminephosphotransferase